MKRLFFSLVASAVFLCETQGNTISWNVISYIPAQDGYTYDSDIFHGNAPSGGFGAYFTRKLTAQYILLSCDNDAYFFLGNNASWWRVLDKGDLVNYDSMIGSYSDYFSYYPDGIGAPIGLQNISIPLGGTIILAFATAGRDWDYPPWDGAPYFYGWVELGYNGKDVYIVKSALETTGLGIYAGTGVVPEPSAALLALMGLSVFGLRRRRVT